MGRSTLLFLLHTQYLVELDSTLMSSKEPYSTTSVILTFLSFELSHTIFNGIFLIDASEGCSSLHLKTKPNLASNSALDSTTLVSPMHRQAT